MIFRRRLVGVALVLARQVWFVNAEELDALGNPLFAEATGAALFPSQAADVNSAGGATAKPLTRGDFGSCATTLDFDDLKGGGIRCDGDIISNQFPGVTFDVPGACQVCARTHLDDATFGSLPNDAFVQQNKCRPNANSMTITFDPPVMSVGAEGIISGKADFQIVAFDDTGKVVEKITAYNLNLKEIRPVFAAVRSDKPNIKMIQMSSNSFVPFNFGFDDLIYEDGRCNERTPFPADLDEASCSYLACINTVLKEFSPKFNDERLDELTAKALLDTKISKNRLRKHGRVLPSLDRLKTAMESIELIDRRGLRRDREDAQSFADIIGESGSTCAIDLVDEFINRYLGEGILNDDFLKALPTNKLKRAREANAAGKWKRSVVLSKHAIRSVLSELGEEVIPLCTA